MGLNDDALLLALGGVATATQEHVADAKARVPIDDGGDGEPEDAEDQGKVGYPLEVLAERDIALQPVPDAREQARDHESERHELLGAEAVGAAELTVVEHA